jgi:rod shape-determining protein MreC
VGLPSERFASRRDTLAFAICLLLSIAVRAAPADMHTTVATSLRRSLLAPFLALQHQAELFRTSRTRYSAVVAQRDSALVAAALLDAVQEENAQLRAALALRARLPLRHLSAEVLHQALPTDGFTLLLSAGARDGVRPLVPVIGPGGLVGVVRSVERRTSVAVAWAHPDFRASAMTADGSVFGIVAPHSGGGPATALLELQGVPYRETVLPGTMIYTSGLATGEGGVYPRGIPIGTVIGVGEEQVGWARTYVVRPEVHPASVSHVILLLETGLDVRAAFPGTNP